MIYFCEDLKSFIMKAKLIIDYDEKVHVYSAHSSELKPY